MWSAEGLKLFNSLLLALVASEWLQKGRLPKRLLGLSIAANAILADWGLQGRAGALFSVVLVVVCTGSIVAYLGVFHPAYLEVPAFARAILNKRSLVIAAPCGLLGLCSGALLLAQGFVQVGKLVAATSLFLVAGYVDVWRCLPDLDLPLSTYLGHVGCVFLWLLPAYPCLAIAATPLLLLVVDVVEAIFGSDTKGRAHLVLNEVVFDGVFYSPFVAIFVWAKWRCLKHHKADSVLPTRSAKIAGE